MTLIRDSNLMIGNHDIFWSFYQYCQNSISHTTTVCESFYKIGDYTIHLKFANETIQKIISPAQLHLIIPKTSQMKADLTIFVSEQVSHNQPLPQLVKAWFGAIAQHPEKYLAPRGEITNGDNQQILIAYNGGSGIVNLYHLEKNIALCLIQDINRLPYYEIGSPFKVIWHWLVQSKGQLMLHAGAVGLEDKGVLLVGKGGSGKSTTALACVDSKLKYLSDDYCVVTWEQPLKVHSLFSTVKLVGKNDLKRFPFINKYLSNSRNIEYEKAMAFVNQFAPEALLNELPLKAICIPKVTGLSATTWERTSPAKALFSIAPSSILQLPYTNQNTFQMISKVASHLPCFYLKIGTDIKQIPENILQILNEL
ncbi:hypothetical protein RIF25_10120 [Thermosynechococcaceae cyanobacterium BACA0444]|uniref:Serine kinase n=1 Tax=Pseudocalidococcus azoricus BACA0444 TaxID=2918990 RepID=A0AAE4JWM0_9CYAN|nr:hypothetical protein [Pseudocalidococcus azoricus]MDS3861161.1 hypothetical protein [Pseudocalidococcus azoricus BACA0444]